MTSLEQQEEEVSVTEESDVFAVDKHDSANSSAVKLAYSSVFSRVQAAVALRPLMRPCRMVAVSKTKPAASILEIYNEGHRHFGENYVQELVSKSLDPSLQIGVGRVKERNLIQSEEYITGASTNKGEETPIRWHFIGQLQSNKSKLLVSSVPALYMVESVDSIKLATLLDKAVSSVDEGGSTTRIFPGPLLVLVQINTSGEPQKGGCEIGTNESIALSRHILQSCPKLKLAGFMTIGRLGEVDGKCFERLVNERKIVSEALGLQEHELELSMGMSGDFELAIEHGATSVRVGSSIFGARESKLNQKV